MFSVDAPGSGDDAATIAAVEALTAKVGVLVVQNDLMMKEIAALREAAEGQADRNRLYDVKALSKLWLVSERTIHTLVSEGHLVPTYVQSNLRFTKEAIKAYERSRAGTKHGRILLARARRSHTHREILWLDGELSAQTGNVGTAKRKPRSNP